MNRTAQIVVAVLAVLFVGVATVLFVKYRETNAKLAETESSEEQVRARYAETIDAIAEIQDSLNAIHVGEGAAMSPSDLQAERRLGGDRSQEALDRIAVLRAGVERSRDRIRELESNLGANQKEMSGLRRLIDNLKRSAVEKETQIAQLTEQVEELRTEVAGLNTVVQVQDSTIAVKQQEVATIYYIAGNKDELKEAGVIESKGGILGIGKTVRPAAAANPRAFIPIDTDRHTVIHTSAKKLEVLTPQPPSSYQVRVIDGYAELHILDPEAFRQVKRLILLTS